jgi:hypothetical protein
LVWQVGHVVGAGIWRGFLDRIYRIYRINRISNLGSRYVSGLLGVFNPVNPVECPSEFPWLHFFA